MKLQTFVVTIVLLGTLVVEPAESFVTPRQPQAPFQSRTSQSQRHSNSSPSPLPPDCDESVENLIRLVQGNGEDDSSTEDKKDTVRNLMTGLEQNFPSSNEGSSRFTPLVGLYDVSYTLSIKENDNPVGGKWTKKNCVMQNFLRTRRTFQHILPTNTTGLSAQNSSIVAEAVNVISLEALWALIRVTVILRGDAIRVSLDERNKNKIPLSNLAVRVLFDAPRIIFGRRGRIANLNIGPSSNVVLDSTYVDDRVRIGMGGTSGSRFVFARCADDDTEANEFQALLLRRPMRRSRAFSTLFAAAGIGLYSAAYHRTLRILGCSISALAALIGLGLVFSSGGIERESPSSS